MAAHELHPHPGRRLVTDTALTPARMSLPDCDKTPKGFTGPSERRRVVMLTVLPVAPPCFDGAAWRAYVLNVAEQENARCRSPLYWHNNQPLYNRAWDYCVECLPRHAAAMAVQGKCVPDFHRKPKGG